MYKHHRLQTYIDSTKEEGAVVGISGAIVEISGLHGLTIGEAVVFEHGGIGKALVLKPNQAEVLLLTPMPVEVGDRVARTGERIMLEVGSFLLGQRVNGLGHAVNAALDSRVDQEWRVIESKPLPVKARSRITRGFMTGVALVDLIVPLGKGQRELVLGDQKTGKTHFALTVVEHQAREGAVVVYAAIGKTAAELQRIQAVLLAKKLVKNVVLVTAEAQSRAGEIFFAPYTAMTIAEYFKDQGRDVVVVLDDLTTHAKFYREISLLARRFPGRDSYPGDIFHIHSRLLERAGSFRMGVKEVTITCLPLADTVASDMTGYIQTNLMSMTDGHLFFDRELFFRGHRPAINPFLSVTRVGRQTQSALRQELSRRMLTVLSAYEKAKRFMRFGTDLPESVRNTIAQGELFWQVFDEDKVHLEGEGIQLLTASLLVNGDLTDELFTNIHERYEQNASWREKVDRLTSTATSVDALLSYAKKELLFSERKEA